MNFFRKNLFGLALASFLTLGGVLTGQAFHHHDALESQADCSFCVWQQTGSQASSVPASPAFLLTLLVFAVFFAFQPSTFATFSLSFQGRAPPQNLL